MPTHSTSTWVKWDQSLVLILIGKVLFVLLSCLSSPLPDSELSESFLLLIVKVIKAIQVDLHGRRNGQVLGLVVCVRGAQRLGL